MLIETFVVYLAKEERGHQNPRSSVSRCTASSSTNIGTLNIVVFLAREERGHQNPRSSVSRCTASSSTRCSAEDQRGHRICTTTPRRLPRQGGARTSKPSLFCFEMYGTIVGGRLHHEIGTALVTPLRRLPRQGGAWTSKPSLFCFEMYGTIVD